MKRLIFSMHFEVPDNQFVDNKETNKIGLTHFEIKNYNINKLYIIIQHEFYYSFKSKVLEN